MVEETSKGPEEVRMENTWRELINAVLCCTDLGL